MQIKSRNACSEIKRVNRISFAVFATIISRKQSNLHVSTLASDCYRAISLNWGVAGQLQFLLQRLNLKSQHRASVITQRSSLLYYLAHWHNAENAQRLPETRLLGSLCGVCAPLHRFPSGLCRATPSSPVQERHCQSHRLGGSCYRLSHRHLLQ